MDFINAIQSGDVVSLKKIPKSDLHNHATRGGNIRDFLDDTNLPPRVFSSLDDMQNWYDLNVKCLFSGRDGFISRVESAFRQAKHDGIKRLALSFGIGDSIHFDSLKEYFNTIRELHKSIASDILFIPELCLGRTQNIDPVIEMFDEVLTYDFFKSVDLVGDDRLSVTNYKPIYRKAKAEGLILKAHLGEFGDADSIRIGVEELELDEVQHGISAVTSDEVMNWLRDNNIQLNLCPSSNLMLSRVVSYKEHPIKKLFQQGVRVTINSDDMLIFDQSVTDDYINLYNSGCMSANDLNIIRNYGLGSSKSRADD